MDLATTCARLGHPALEDGHCDCGQTMNDEAEMLLWPLVFVALDGL